MYGYEKNEILKRVGDISQICRIERCAYVEGPEKGVEIFNIKTGSGFNFTVSPDRGLDIPFADYKGTPLCWVSGTGIRHPHIYEPHGIGWLRGFHGGLLVTCGMTQVGVPSEGEGLHGRISYEQARNLYSKAFWEDERYILKVGGTVRESRLFGYSLELNREIETEMFSKKIVVRDVVKNIGARDAPHMMLYHINLGFPVVSEKTEIVIKSDKVEPRDEESAKGIERWNIFEEPKRGFIEHVFYHTVREPSCYVINKSIGIGIYIKYSKETLPVLVEWKMCGEKEYVLGIEPANCRVEGREKERNRGTLKFLKPEDSVEYSLEIGVLDMDEIEDLNV